MKTDAELYLHYSAATIDAAAALSDGEWPRIAYHADAIAQMMVERYRSRFPADPPTTEPDIDSRWTAALRMAEPTGASAKTAAQDGLSGGVTSSIQMARTDLDRVLNMLHVFVVAADWSGLPAELLAAIASRESRCGAALDEDGRGDRGYAYGIMQIDSRYHEANMRDGPRGVAHVVQAADILYAYLMDVSLRHPDWSDSHKLQGAAVAYNSGVANVQTIKGMDRGTTGDDYGSDVIARAQFYLDVL